MEKGLFEKTGKTLEQWIDIVKKQKLEKHGEILKFLKSDHAMTHGFANFVALKARGADSASHDPESLVQAQYETKQELRPIYERLLKEVLSFGSDVEVAPKKTAVSFRRKKQFALVQPSTKTRIDLGLKLKDVANTERLESSGPFGAMCSHRVRLTELGQIDAELIGWLKQAYEQAG